MEFALLHRAIHERLSGKVTFEKCLEANKGVSHGEIQGGKSEQRRPRSQLWLMG